MKYLIFAVLIAFSVPAFSQSTIVKNNGDKLNIPFKRTYLVQTDTTPAGIVTITIIPTKEAATDLQKRVDALTKRRGNVAAQLAALDSKIAGLQKIILAEKAKKK